MCAVLLGATWPVLLALPALPVRVVLGDVYAVSQGSGAASVNASLVANLSAQPWAETVSAEILAFVTIRGEPVLVRGADTDSFLRLEGGMWVDPPLADGAVAGSNLATRFSLGVGDVVTLVGSTLPRLEVVSITGVFTGAGLGDDELLVPHPLARDLTGVGADAFHVIRVKASRPEGLLAFLEAFRASVHVSGPGLPRADVNSDPPSDERLTNLLLRSGRGTLPRDYLTNAVQEATDSVRVVSWGLAGLIGLLAFLGIHAVQARAFADRRAAVGVLRAVGAGDLWVRGRFLLESLPIATAAGALGTGIGIVVAMAIGLASVVHLFGHTVVPTFDAGTILLGIGGVVAAASASGLLVLERALRARPMESVQERVVPAGPQSLEVILRG